jgi:mitochondrial fission protein ELM1
LRCAKAMPVNARCLVLSNGMVGAEKQALALAEAIGLPFEVRRVKQVIPALSRLPSSVLASATHLLGSVGVSGIGPIDAPYPALAISCGRGSIPASIALRDAGRGSTLTVHIQRPECSASWFDLVIVPRHDYPTLAPPNAVLTRGSLHSVTPELLAAARREWEPVLRPFPSPRLTLLLGGTGEIATDCPH